MKQARKLFGQYRRSEANDPEVYVESVSLIFADYPDATVEFVTHPVTGLAANPIPDPRTGQVWKGLPDLADVKTACEAHYGVKRRAMQREKAARKQIEQRLALEVPRETRPTLDQLEQKLGRPISPVPQKQAGAVTADGDGRHAERVAADLAARAARRASQSPDTSP